jgi:hypothetical protein
MIQDSREEPRMYSWDPPDEPGIETVNDSNWREFTSSTWAVLVLTQSNCPACRGWLVELQSFLSGSTGWNKVRFGRIAIDGEDSKEFRRVNDWIEEIEFTPFTAVFVRGEPKSSFYGAGIEELLKQFKLLGIRTA